MLLWLRTRSTANAVAIRYSVASKLAPYGLPPSPQCYAEQNKYLLLWLSR